MGSWRRESLKGQSGKTPVKQQCFGGIICEIVSNNDNNGWLLCTLTNSMCFAKNVSVHKNSNIKLGADKSK